MTTGDGLGALYGIGVGPGDPELLTVAAVRRLSACGNVFVPRARVKAESVALAIARPYVPPDARVEELLFPMTGERAELEARWREAAWRVCSVLREGRDACFLTLGDPSLYSTWIYLVREVRQLLPRAEVVTVPGVPAFCAVAALTGFPLGEGKEPVTIVPASDDLAAVERALDAGGTVVLMKIGGRLREVLDCLERRGLLGSAVLVSRAGFPEQRVETDLGQLARPPDLASDVGYLSIVLVHARHAEVTTP